MWYYPTLPLAIPYPTVNVSPNPQLRLAYSPHNIIGAKVTKVHPGVTLDKKVPFLLLDSE